MDVVNRQPSLASIQFLTGPLAGNTVQISKTTITIGREPGNDIVISDPTVSRQHARLIYNGSQWSIEKLNLQNTLAVNRREVQQTVISDRDTISIGPGTSFLFISGAGTKRPVPPPPMQPQQVPFPSPQRPFNVQSWPQQQHQVVASSPAPMPTVAAPPPRPGQPGGGTQASLFTAGSEVSAGTANIRGVPSLEISSNVHQDKQAYPLTTQVINIGRDPSNDIVINELVVSGFHAQIVREGNQFVLVHPHPSRGKTVNGLLYQGRHIQGDEKFRKPLARGDIFRIGDEHGTLVTLTYNDGSGAIQDVVSEVHPIPLGAPVITIGRLPENMVVLSHPQVSGRHARLEQVQGGYRIIDVGSTNYVYVNAQRVTNQVLRPGDEIRIGPYKFTYTGTQLTQQDESKGIRIDALHLQKVGSKHTILINDISIAIPQRTFVALVGGSGAGKSMLMDALNGLRPAQKGLVLYNGQDYYSHLAAFSTQLGYVPQDDIIHRDLTVERALYYTARMRLPEDFTQMQIKQRIDEVLEDVEIKHRRGMLVNKLSGGQRKRVSIALELLANPSIFFLDEPTSGLDPGLDRKMMFLLRRLADRGRTIVLVTHATNNINACDYVCFLAAGGHLAYYGPPDDAKTFFGKTDFAEIYGDLEPTDTNPNIPAEREEDFKRSPDYQKYVDDPIKQTTHYLKAPQQAVRTSGSRRSKSWRQFAWLSMRYIELLKNDIGNLLILLLQAPVIGLIMLLFIHFGINSGGFDPPHVVQCLTTAQILTASGLPDIPNPPKDAQFKSCSRVEEFLMHDPMGKAYAAKRGGERQALQDFILPGPGDGPKLLFIMAFAAVMFGCINAAREIVKEAPEGIS